MKLGIRTWALLCGMLPAFGFSAFIQSPIPPSTSKNFFKDMNGDSQMDQVEIVFLGNLSREYLDSTVARLELNWKDRNGISQVLTFPGSELPFNASNVNSIVLDLSQNPNLYRNTSLTEKSKTAKIVFRDSSELPISMSEKLSPIVESAYLAHHGSGKDSLRVRFSAPVSETSPNADFLEFKHAGDVHTISAAQVEWDADRSSALLICDAGQGFPLPRDSIRVLAGMLQDSLLNKSLATAPYAKIAGAYPFELQTNSLAMIRESDTLDHAPIFERVSADTSAKLPSSAEHGVALKIGGKDFREYVQEFANSSTEKVLPSDISIHLSLRLYTTSGAYVTSVTSETSCSASHFLNGTCLENPQTFFLKWNLMANDRSIVATGAYLAKIFATIRYKDKVLWKSDSGKNAAQIWGVKRNLK